MPARCRQPAAGLDHVTTARDPPRPSTIAAAAAQLVPLAVLLLLVVVGALSPTPTVAAAAGISTSGLATMTSSEHAWWTTDEAGTRLSAVPRRFRHRRHRHRQRSEPTLKPIFGFDRFRPPPPPLPQPPQFASSTTDNATVSGGRRRFRHVDDKTTSGGGGSVFKVVVDRRPSDGDNDDPVRLWAAAESGDISGGTSARFRFCRYRPVSSALDPVRCVGTSGDVARRCLDELAALDDEAEAKFRRFADAMAFFDCGHAYSLASDCGDCEVGVNHSCE